ncbi:MAG TPA: D-alanine--D-alanine ligase family protein [Bryobacteraceae bacterium]|jgi:D-alanine-D-alanine ligase
MKRLRVAVLCGGRSGEHEVSINSAESIIAAMDQGRYEVERIFITKEGRWQPRAISPEPDGNPGIDVVFPALHGTFGEDGTVQGLLELAGLPYVGAGVLASAASMDKDVMKRLCRERGIPVVDHIVVMRGAAQTEQICRKLPFPMFVKPANLGSSVGISKVRTCEELKAALELAGRYDRKIVVERGVEGREFECSVMGNGQPMAAIPCEILPSREFYDYEDKYLLNQAQVVLPADLTPPQTAEMQRLTVECYQAVGCEGMARVDFLMETKTGSMYVNEINTVPGFTAISMFPKMWEKSGLPYPKLIDRLIELALERHRERQATRFSR